MSVRLIQFSLHPRKRCQQGRQPRRSLLTSRCYHPVGKGVRAELLAGSDHVTKAIQSRRSRTLKELESDFCKMVLTKQKRVFNTVWNKDLPPSGADQKDRGTKTKPSRDPPDHWSLLKNLSWKNKRTKERSKESQPVWEVNFTLWAPELPPVSQLTGSRLTLPAELEVKRWEVRLSTS